MAFSVCLRLSSNLHWTHVSDQASLNHQFISPTSYVFFSHLCFMGQQLTGMVSVEKVMSCSNTHHVMTTCILCYALKAGESQSASFQSNNSLTGGSFDVKLSFTQSCIYCILHVAKKRATGAGMKVSTEQREWQSMWGKEWIAVGLRAISSFKKKWSSSREHRGLPFTELLCLEVLKFDWYNLNILCC